MRAHIIKVILKLIVFVAICSAITAYLAFTIGNIKPFEDRYTIAAVFDDVNGLLKNDNVKVAGVPVGKVTAIQVVDGRARVTMKIRKELRLRSDVKAAVRWRNLLGQRYVYLFPGTAATTLLPGKDITNTVEVVDLGELFNRLGPIVERIEPSKVNTFLDNIVAALDGNEDALRGAIADLGTVTQAIASRDDAIGRLITNLDVVTGAINSRETQIKSVLDNLLLVAETFSANTDVLDAAVTELGTFSHELGTLLANNRTDIDRTVTNISQIVDVVRTKLPVLDGTVERLDDAFRVIFNSARHGEWLNQTIPCGRVITVEVPACITDVDSVGVLSSPTSITRGADAIRQLIAPGVAR